MRKKAKQNTTATKKQKQGPCWPGYVRVPGRKAFTKGSCKKATSSKTK